MSSCGVPPLSMPHPPMIESKNPQELGGAEIILQWFSNSSFLFSSLGLPESKGWEGPLTLSCFTLLAAENRLVWEHRVRVPCELEVGVQATTLLTYLCDSGKVASPPEPVSFSVKGVIMSAPQAPLGSLEEVIYKILVSAWHTGSNAEVSCDKTQHNTACEM